MPTKSLPSKPSLDHLKMQSCDLLKAVRQGNADAIERVNATASKEHHLKPNPQPFFKLADAQRVIAREYGLPSWPKLKREILRRTLTFPQRVEEFVRCATNGRTGRAKELLEDEPRIAKTNVYTACVLGDTETLKAALEEDPSLATQKGGPRGDQWTLLHYVSFSRLNQSNPDITEGLNHCAQLLLERGADVNAPYLEPNWPESPQLPLYGAAGEANNYPLAKTLIDAGANLDDGEAIYHACEHYYLECMELLRDAGLDLSKRNGIWNNTPLYFMLGYLAYAKSGETALKSIDWLLKQGVDVNVLCGDVQETALHKAIEQRQSLTLLQDLLEHGGDPNIQRKDGMTPYHLTLRTGMDEHAEAMRKHGAKPVTLQPNDKLIAACYRGNEKEALQLVSENPGLIENLTEEEHKNLRLSAIHNIPKAIRVFHKVGFDINFIGSKEWDATALHYAGWNGCFEAVAVLLALGAKPVIAANQPEDGPPLGWAIHGSEFCGNKKGDYVSIVRALIKAGATPFEYQLNMGSDEVKEVLLEHL